MMINEKNFKEEVLEAPVPVVADFKADWCGTCRRLAPVVDRLKEEFAGKIKVVKVDVDESAGLADQFEVETLPTLYLFRDGQAISSVISPGSQDAIEDWLKENQAL